MSRAPLERFQVRNQIASLLLIWNPGECHDGAR
jgi:hypothetical protein